MRAPGFWQAGPDHPAARLLRPAAALYGGLAARRMDRPGIRAACPVVCLGNFTLGGAGKTPTALAVADLLVGLGRRPAFLSRGYGGREPGPLRVDPAAHGADAVGDEPLLLARRAPAVVARDRVAGAALCRALGADAVVMDDGLQNPGLAKDLALAVVDAGAGLGNGLPFPAGPLRAPLDRQWPHVHGLVLVGEGRAGDAAAAAAEGRGLPVHRAALVAEAGALPDRPLLAFAGIGRPEKFFATLEGAGARLAATRAFPDHHPYRAAGLARRVHVLPVRLVLADPGRLAAQLAAALAAALVRAGPSPSGGS